MRKPTWISAAAAAVTYLALTASVASAQTTVLYDGAGTPAAPESQGWLFHFVESPGTKLTAGGQTTLDTSADSDVRGGFSNRVPLFNTLVNAAFPTLDRTTGYTVRLDARLIEEAHDSLHRAGMSLIVLSSDLQGIELGFWDNEIWAQSGPTFTHAEGVAFDTTDAITSYQLTIQGSTYALSADGVPQLSGSLRDYSSFGVPYSLSNYLFLGDNTTSAAGRFEFDHLSVTIPEPGAAALGMLLALLPLRRRRCR